MNARDTQVAKAAAVAARIPRCVKWGHELAVDGWRVCACGRLLPEHADTAPDPAGGGGCGMCWRVCACCEFVDEHHVTEHDDLAYGPIGGRVVQVQPGGYLRHDVSAGLVLPNHRKDSEENVMVGRGGAGEPTVAALVAAAVQAGRAVLDAYVGDDRPVVLDDLRDALDDLSGAVDVVVGGGR